MAANSAMTRINVSAEYADTRTSVGLALGAELTINSIYRDRRGQLTTHKTPPRT
jgi:hypothetical protein